MSVFWVGPDGSYGKSSQVPPGAEQVTEAQFQFKVAALNAAYERDWARITAEADAKRAEMSAGREAESIERAVGSGVAGLTTAIARLQDDVGKLKKESKRQDDKRDDEALELDEAE